MANCNGLFVEYNKTIRLDNDRRVKLRVKRNNLRSRISGGYSIVKNLDKLEHLMEFQSQGSYVMDTIINPEDPNDQYDLDDGIYFIGSLNRDDRPQPETFHNWIIKSIKSGQSDYEINEIIDKNTCVRVVYSSVDGDINYHIDLPIYYVNSTNEPDLANKKDWWHISNPVKFIIWFEDLMESGFKSEYILKSTSYEDEYRTWLNDIRKKDHQLRRIVRYLKAWGDFKKGDMPLGIIMTILAGLNYVPNDRDDVSLKDTLIKINEYLANNGFKCLRPTTPEDEDLFENYSDSKKEYFKNALNSFVVSAKKAIDLSNQKESSEEWEKHLGKRFPKGQNIDSDTKEKRAKGYT